MWHPPGSHSYVLLNKEIVVSTDDGTALIVDSLVEKAFLRQVFLPFFDVACLNISSCFACSFLCNPPPCQQFLQEVVVLSSALSIQGFCFSSSSFIFWTNSLYVGFLSDASEPKAMALLWRFRRRIWPPYDVRLCQLFLGGKSNFFPMLSFPVVTIERRFL